MIAQVKKYESISSEYGDNSCIFPAGSGGIRLFPKLGIIDLRNYQKM